MPESKQITVVIVDDHPVVRDGLCAMIAAQEDLLVAAEVGTGAEALAIIPDLRPTVVLMDLLLPDINGSEVIRRISEKSSDIGFIVLTTVAGDEEIYRAIEAGARGYLFKDMARKELIQAIRTVAKGQRYIPATVGSRIAENLPRPGLTDREIHVCSTWPAACGTKKSPTSSGFRKRPSTRTSSTFSKNCTRPTAR